jgi:hypothetical protein
MRGSNTPLVLEWISKMALELSLGCIPVESILIEPFWAKPFSKIKKSVIREQHNFFSWKKIDF